jgi:hypothetical protein
MTNTNSIGALAPSRIRVSKKLIDIVTQHMKSSDNQPTGITSIHFKDSTYSAVHGGFHPVEVGIHQTNGQVFILYITDYSFADDSPNELIKDIDFDFGNQVVFSKYLGWQRLNTSVSKELYDLWESNFLSYIDMDAFDQITINGDKSL